MIKPIKRPTKPSYQGFTLMELSIVLIIIGLIIGGIVVGSEMINSAKIRSQIRQIERFDSAANTFRTKYNCIAGDCKNAANFGFQARSGAYGDGDGNGVLTAATGYPSDMYKNGELLIFWNDLARASLITDPIDGDAVVCLGSLSGSPTSAEIARCFPLCTLGSGTCSVSLFTAPTTMQTYYFLAEPTTYPPFVGNIRTSAFSAAGLTPSEAMTMDIKMDDGDPSNGKFTLAKLADSSLATNETAGATSCITASNVYNSNPTYANTRLCIPRIKVGF